MFCTVYCLRHRGHKLPREDVRAHYARGDLRFDVRLVRGSYQVMKAQLLSSDGETYRLPVLDKARLVRIGPGGLLITGIEIIPRSRGIKNIRADYFPQTWYCMPTTAPAAPCAPPEPADENWRADALRDAAAMLTRS